MLRYLQLLLVAVALAIPHAIAQPTAHPDTSPHRATFVTVEDGVSLEVLDWGGTGRPLIFLSGGGSSAHAFDTFAPQFTSKHHVFAITRRGAGKSSAPSPINGAYSTDRLGDDVLAVVKDLDLNRPVLAGWSIAGTELSSIGSRHPEAASGLIYLEAGYSYASYDPKAGNLLVDANAVRDELDKLISLNGPELIGPTDQRVPDLIQNLRSSTLPKLDADLDRWRTIVASLPLTPPQSSNSPINTAILEGAKRNGQIASPILAIFAMPHKWPSLGDAASDAKISEEDKAWGEAAADTFQAENPGARVVRIANAGHDVWRTNETEVVKEMNAFMDKL